MKKETEILYLKALEHYKESKSITKTAKHFKIGRKWFALFIRDKIKVINYQNQINYNQDVFEKINSEEKAYWLGFMYADGYVSKTSNDIEIALQLSDYKHLEKFNLFLNRNTPVKKDSYRCRIVINNKKLHDDLIKLGCVPKKSLILKFPNRRQVPKKYIPSFVRGYVDGDGSIMSRVNKNYVSPILSIIGTKEFLIQLRIEMDWKILKLYKDKRHANNTFFISYIGKYVYEMLDILYKNSSIHLDRKYNKYIKLQNCRLLE